MITSYEIEGMHCESCVAKITAALQRVAGVVSTRVSLSPPHADIEANRPIPFSDLHNAVHGVGEYALKEPSNETTNEASSQKAVVSGENLYPLALIIGYLTGTVVLVAAVTNDWSLHRLMNHFMGSFFLVFSFFKLLDLQGFVGAYRSYDLIAQRAPAWGFFYPFVEMALGVAYIAEWKPLFVNSVTLVLMIAGAAGVLKSLLNKQTIRCACLGTVLNLPMTQVTLIEDLGMAAMAAFMVLRFL